jgi:hypothetical protein
MRRIVLNVAALGALAVTFACQSPASPRDVTWSGSDRPPIRVDEVGQANASCSYSPSGSVYIPTSSTQTFTPSNVSDCDGAYGVLSSALTVGFTQGTACSLRETQEAGFSLFKVRRCLTGTVTFTIYTNSSRTTALQVITLDASP